MLRLEELGLLELHPGDRIRLLHTGVHNLLLGGPLARADRAALLAWCEGRLADPGEGIATSSDRSVGPAFVEQARGELRELAQRWRDRAYRDEQTVPLARRTRLRWLLVLDEITTE